MAIHFWRGSKIEEPNIFLNGTKITAVNEARFLGLIFDRRLTFKNHIEDLETFLARIVASLFFQYTIHPVKVRGKF